MEKIANRQDALSDAPVRKASVRAADRAEDLHEPRVVEIEECRIEALSSSLDEVLNYRGRQHVGLKTEVG